MNTQKTVSVFIMMPFGSNEEYREGIDESDYVYEQIIKPGIELVFNADKYDMKVIRETDRNTPGSVTFEMIRNIARSDIVIADITGRNPNVFFELGVRYALRDNITLLTAQVGTIPPFDVRNYRTVFYQIVKPDVARMQIADAIKEGLSKPHKSDSLVFDSFSEISVVIPGYCESHSHDQTVDKNIMLWPEYWNRIESICGLLEGPVTNGQFAPDAIMGISNGGMIAADLIGRMLFRGKPILSLWADRFSKRVEANESYYFFDNDYNDALINVLRKEVGGRNVVILLLDDHLGTGTTARQAAAYLNTRFKKQVEILFIPMFSKRPEYIEQVEDLFPYRFQGGRIFTYSDRDEFIKSIDTKAHNFPYRKEISYGA